MPERPGSRLASRPLHLFFVADCSGSMASDGKIRALNAAIREALPHLSTLAESNPHAEIFVRCIAFSSGARWHVEQPTRVEELEWSDLRAGGYTDAGAALELLRSVLTVPPMQARAFPPAIILISDGLPTDDFDEALADLLTEPWGARSVRLAIGIGRDADDATLARFMGDDAIAPMTANNPEQLLEAIRWASTQVSRAASCLSNSLSLIDQGRTPHVESEAPSEMVW